VAGWSRDAGDGVQRSWRKPSAAGVFNQWRVGTPPRDVTFREGPSDGTTVCPNQPRWAVGGIQSRRCAPDHEGWAWAALSLGQPSPRPSNLVATEGTAPGDSVPSVGPRQPRRAAIRPGDGPGPPPWGGPALWAFHPVGHRTRGFFRIPAAPAPIELAGGHPRHVLWTKCRRRNADTVAQGGPSSPSPRQHRGEGKQKSRAGGRPAGPLRDGERSLPAQAEWAAKAPSPPGAFRPARRPTPGDRSACTSRPISTGLFFWSALPCQGKEDTAKTHVLSPDLVDLHRCPAPSAPPAYSDSHPSTNNSSHIGKRSCTVRWNGGFWLKGGLHMLSRRHGPTSRCWRLARRPTAPIQRQLSALTSRRDWSTGPRARTTRAGSPWYEGGNLERALPHDRFQRAQRRRLNSLG